MNVVYFSPVPWNSYTQRPHEFIKFLSYHTNHSKFAKFLWINPFPTRLPRITDFYRRPDLVQTKSSIELPALTVLDVPSLPVEPLPVIRMLNDLIWKSVKRQILHFCQESEGQTVIACGKPSRLSLWALKNINASSSLYDRMDDFSQFYSGLSRVAMQSWEKQILKYVDHVSVSAENLAEHIADFCPEITLIENGYDMHSLPMPSGDQISEGPPYVFGYVGSIAQWFDWDLTIALARENPESIVRLIGPCFVTPPHLPDNIEIKKACPREELIEQIQQFSVGIIPFKKSRLSESIDPIKFYEYRGLGKPVLSTRFGTMPRHAATGGGVVFFEDIKLNHCLERCKEVTPTRDEIETFRTTSDWSTRFQKLSSFFPSSESL